MNRRLAAAARIVRSTAVPRTTTKEKESVLTAVPVITTGVNRPVLVAWGVVWVLLAAGSAAAQEVSPQRYQLTGVVRDFSSSHADFASIEASSFGVHAGNIALILGPDGRPVFAGGGSGVWFPWIDSAGHPIAPHMFNFSCSLDPPPGSGRTSLFLTVRERIEVKDFSVVDSFDSNLGPYGGANVGNDALLSIGGTKKDSVRVKKHSMINGHVLITPGADAGKVIRVDRSSSITGAIGEMDQPLEFPIIEMPDPGPDVGELEYEGGEHTISSNLRCDELELEDGAIVWIDGEVVIQCETLEMEDGAEIRLLPDATLTLFVSKELELENHSKLNMDPGNPQQVSIYMIPRARGADEEEEDDDDDDHGGGKIVLKKQSQLAAWVQGDSAELKIKDESEFFGSFAGRQVKVEKRSSLHVDLAAGADTTEPDPIDLGDVVGIWGSPTDSGIQSAETFDEWFRDIPGVNMSQHHTITLTRDAAGVYEFQSSDFNPIDNVLMGNDGEAHNYFFTYEIDATFTYEQDAGQYLLVHGIGDAYVFVNGALAIDLGGLGYNGGKTQCLFLDRFCLENGQTARIQIFHAQRSRSLAIWRLRTNMVLSTQDSTATTILTFSD